MSTTAPGRFAVAYSAAKRADASRILHVVQVSHRRGDVGVTHHRLDLVNREPLSRLRAEAMAEVVKADLGQAGALEVGLEVPVDRHAAQRLSRLLRVLKDKGILGLACTVGQERSAHVVGHRNRAHATTLGASVAPACREAALETNPPRDEVDVPDSERPDLRLARPSLNREDVNRSIQVRGRRRLENRDLSGRVEPKLAFCLGLHGHEPPDQRRACEGCVPVPSAPDDRGGSDLQRVGTACQRPAVLSAREWLRRSAFRSCRAVDRPRSASARQPRSRGESLGDPAVVAEAWSGAGRARAHMRRRMNPHSASPKVRRLSVSRVSRRRMNDQGTLGRPTQLGSASGSRTGGRLAFRPRLADVMRESFPLGRPVAQDPDRMHVAACPCASVEEARRSRADSVFLACIGTNPPGCRAPGRSRAAGAMSEAPRSRRGLPFVGIILPLAFLSSARLPRAYRGGSSAPASRSESGPSRDRA